ncbi:MAG: hypothetical protein A2Z75_02870 [Chloroflexi bacterium RBG_13_50_10]|nr:MAG: hypothetical protein A2Z75_02870 [Chloroflexi bacterium RBG_13_50_10]
MSSKSEPRYVISVAAVMIGIEPHTLRYYERLGLIRPQRSEGKIRLYSEDDIEQLRYVKTLMSDCGVNLAGVEVALHLIQRIREMQNQIEEMGKRIRETTKTGIEDVIQDLEWREE